ncbi:MAG: GHMP kinase [Bacteroidetes bacterium]|nr:GHMP kinase [Bacteroidota bacterium]
MLYPTHKANGKLLLTAEYFVLDGANAIALPTKFGQSLQVEINSQSSPFIHWISLDALQNSWLDISLDLNLSANSSDEISCRLIDVLKVCIELNPVKLDLTKSYVFTTQIDFDRSWGLGTSSTLIRLLADFFEINPYILLERTFGGSGYDIACSNMHGPIVYNNRNPYNPEIVRIHLNKSYFDAVFFVYLGNKQHSRDGMKHYRSLIMDKLTIIQDIEDINRQILQSEKLSEFEKAIEEHERIISSNLQIPRLSETLFRDYWGSVKSLGAWGGDFVLMTNDRPIDELKQYLKNKHMNVCFPYREIIY